MCSLLCASSLVATSLNGEGVNTDEPLLTTTSAVDEKPEVNKENMKPEEKPEEPALPVTYDQRQEGQYNFRGRIFNNFYKYLN